MSNLTDKDVKHTAKLSQLELTDEEVETFKKQLSEVIGYVEELNEVDTDSVEPTSQSTGLENSLREDERDTSYSLETGEALSGTEKVLNDYFVVPMVLEERTDR